MRVWGDALVRACVRACVRECVRECIVLAYPRNEWTTAGEVDKLEQIEGNVRNNTTKHKEKKYYMSALNKKKFFFGSKKILLLFKKMFLHQENIFFVESVRVL